MKNKFKPKIISGIMAGTMLVCNTTPAYAAQWEVEGEEALPGTERAAIVTYNPGASFMVSVPKTIVLDAETKSADYHITVKGGIENRTEVVVAPKDDIPDTGGVNFYMSDKSVYKKGNVVATVTQESTEWPASEVTESGTTKKGNVSAQDLSYGDWSGNLIFMIRLCEDHEHNYENGICTECGKADPSHEHNYTEKVIKEATCTKTGEKTLICACGDTKTESIPTTGHNYKDGSCTECGEADPDHEHSYTEKVTKEATCTKTGEKTLICDCGDSKTEGIPSTGHKYENGSCTECGEADPDHEHSYTETVTKEATCTEAGEKTLTCVCGDSKTESIPTTGHKYEDGSCTECGEADPDHEHSYTETVTKEATCTEAGEKTLTCVCGDSKTEVVPSTGHDYSDGTCNNCGEADPDYVADPYPLAPEDAYMNWNYTLDEADKTITLNYYTGSETDVTVYSAYPVAGTTYKTKIASNTSNQTTNYMFAGKNTVQSIKFGGNIDTSETASMSGMFINCRALTSLDLSNLGTGNVVDMFRMFSNCDSLTGLDLSNFDTGNVTNMSYMFSNCDSLTSLDLSKLDTGNVTDMSFMFYSNNARVASLTSLDLSSFDTSNVTNMKNMFGYCDSLTGIDVSNFDTGNVTNMSGMFYQCNKLISLDLSNFDTGNVTDMRDMFSMSYTGSSLTNLDISNFNTSNVTNMSGMFYQCNKLISLDVSNFDTGKVTSMGSMFSGCSSLTSLNVSNFDTSKVTSMSGMFRSCSSLTNLNVSNFDTSKVTDMGGMFPDCSSLTSLNVGNFDTSNVTGMNEMFSGCSSLTSLSVSNFNTGKVTFMSKMFKNCSSLTSLDLSNFDTRKATRMDEMFADTPKLKTVYVTGSKWSTYQAYSSGMFTNCGTSSVTYK